MAQPKALKSPFSQSQRSLRSPSSDSEEQAMINEAIQEPMPDISLSPEEVAASEEVSQQDQQEQAQLEAEIAAVTAPEQQALKDELIRAKAAQALGLSKGLTSAGVSTLAGAGTAGLFNLTRLGNVVSPGIAGAAAAVGAGILTQVKTDKLYRDIFGIDQPKTESEKDKILKDAILDEVSGYGIGAAVPLAIRWGTKALSGIANGAEINRVRALTTIESVLGNLESAFGSKLSQKEVGERFLGMLAKERELAGTSIGNIKNAASMIENHSGSTSSVSNTIKAFQDILQKEGVIFKDNEIIGIAEGRGMAPFSVEGTRGKRELNKLISQYGEILSAVKQRKGIPVSEIDKLGTSFESMASAEAAQPGNSTYLQKSLGDISRALNSDRDIAYDRLLTGTEYEKIWKDKIWAPNQNKLGLIKDAQNAFSNENISRIVVENRPDLVNKMISVFGKESEVVSSMRDVYVKRLLEKDPGLEVLNPNKVLQKLNTSDSVLSDLFSTKEIVEMKRFAVQAKRLNSSRFASSVGADRFADDAISIAAKITNPKAAASALYEIASQNAGVYKKINSALLERAKNLPPRDADFYNDLAERLSDMATFSVPVSGPSGIIKLVPGPLLKRILVREMPSAIYKQSKVSKKQAAIESESSNIQSVPKASDDDMILDDSDI